MLLVWPEEGGIGKTGDGGGDSNSVRAESWWQVGMGNLHFGQSWARRSQHLEMMQLLQLLCQDQCYIACILMCDRWRGKQWLGSLF